MASSRKKKRRVAVIICKTRTNYLKNAVIACPFALIYIFWYFIFFVVWVPTFTRIYFYEAVRIRNLIYADVKIKKKNGCATKRKREMVAEKKATGLNDFSRVTQLCER